MSQFPGNSYVFDDFIFDHEKLALYHRNVLVKNADKKSLQVLAALLQNPNQVTSQEEIVKLVWQDNPHGVTGVHIGQYISRLRKIFAEFAPGENYIQTVKGRGYMFTGNVSSDGAGAPENFVDENFENIPVVPEARRKEEKNIFSFDSARPALIFLILIPAGLLTVLGWWAFSESNEDEIKQVVKESQLYESLVLYRTPSAFSEEALDKYWTAELDINSNYDRHRIREAVQKLNAEGRRYGSETKCELFEFQSIEINQKRDFAIVKTLEKWFIAVYFNDGTLQKNKTVGPYFVSYILRKIDGRWLIEKSTTARVNRPTPRLSGIEAVSEVKPREQFLVRITGQDFEPETVYIEVTGEGCPESSPCKVPNSALRDHSKLADNALENVPLTLASGDFRITARNGDSQPSNVVVLSVP